MILKSSLKRLVLFIDKASNHRKEGGQKMDTNTQFSISSLNKDGKTVFFLVGTIYQNNEPVVSKILLGPMDKKLNAKVALSVYREKGGKYLCEELYNERNEAGKIDEVRYKKNLFSTMH